MRCGALHFLVIAVCIYRRKYLQDVRKSRIVDFGAVIHCRGMTRSCPRQRVAAFSTVLSVICSRKRKSAAGSKSPLTRARPSHAPTGNHRSKINQFCIMHILQVLAASLRRCVIGSAIARIQPRDENQRHADTGQGKDARNSLQKTEIEAE